jgi:hypothetical protein
MHWAIEDGLDMIEYFRLNIEYLMYASGGSIIKMTERSDIHKYSIFNSQ